MISKNVVRISCKLKSDTIILYDKHDPVYHSFTETDHDAPV